MTSRIGIFLWISKTVLQAWQTWTLLIMIFLHDSSINYILDNKYSLILMIKLYKYHMKDYLECSIFFCNYFVYIFNCYRFSWSILYSLYFPLYFDKRNILKSASFSVYLTYSPLTWLFISSIRLCILFSQFL